MLETTDWNWQGQLSHWRRNGTEETITPNPSVVYVFTLQLYCFLRITKFKHTTLRLSKTQRQGRSAAEPARRTPGYLKLWLKLKLGYQTVTENYSTWNQKPLLQLCPYSLESCHSSTRENPDALGLFQTKRQSQSQGNKRISERSAGAAVEHQIDKDRFLDRSPI